ncbi:hypothetical protein RI367_003071 [Sorochytrium milnesiophthora]
MEAPKSFKLAHSTSDYVWFRAKHRDYGRVILKCCHQNADSAAIARLRWEYYVTRGLEQSHFVVPIEPIHGFESSSFGLIFPEFRNPQRGFPPRPKAPSSGHSSDEKTSNSSEYEVILTTASDYTGSPSLQQADFVQVTLGDYLCSRGMLDVDQAVQLIRRVVVALKMLHDRSIVFRNLSFDTILLEFPSGDDRTTRDWDRMRVKLTDFSHASKLPGEVVPHSVVDFVLFGDVRFMSPESTGRMNRNIDRRSDFYSLGMVIHGAVTGNAPPPTMSMLNILHYHVAVLPAPLTQHYRGEASGKKTLQFMRKISGLQQVLDKLVAKLPENRYQMCDDILSDLDQLIECIDSSSEFVSRNAGKQDDIMSNTQLYGRANEIDKIRRFQRKVYTSMSGGVLLVTGASGVGKTSLVQELVLPAFSMGGVYCSGKFDQFKRGLPFVPFVQAFTDMINILLLEEPIRLRALAAQIQEQLQENVNILFDVIPNFRHLMNPRDGSSRSEDGSVQPYDTEADQEQRQQQQIQTLQQVAAVSADSNLTPGEILSRMHKTFTAFLEIVSAYKPLTILIDDVQWADWSTSRYIMRLISEGMPQRVMLVLTYRSDEIAANQHLHDLSSQLQSYWDRGLIMLCELSLGNMDKASIAAMLGEMCQNRRLTAQSHGSEELIDLIHDKTLGNPHYVRRFLQIMLDLGALKQSRKDGSWTWDIEQIRAAMPMDNVVEMLVGQLRLLDGKTRLLLKIASVLGTEFDLDMFAKLLRTPPAAVWSAMMPAVSGGYARIIRGATHPPVGLLDADELGYKDLNDFAAREEHKTERVLPMLDGVTLQHTEAGYGLLPADGQASIFTPNSKDSPDVRDPDSEVCYQWEHDRMQQAAYTLINPRFLPLVHLKVGLWQLQSTSAETLSEDIFDIVHHLLIAKPLFNDKRDKENLAKLFAVAASRAKRHIALDAAVNYSREAIKLLDDSIWQTDENFAFIAHFGLLETAFGVGNYPEMKQQIDLLHKHCKQKFHQAMVYEEEIRYCIGQQQMATAAKCGLQALEELNYPLPEDEEVIETLLKKARRSPEEIAAMVRNPVVTDTTAQAAVRIMVSLLPPMYFVAQEKLPSLLLSATEISATKGNSDYGAFGFQLTALLFSGTYNDVSLAYEYGKLGLAVANSLPPTALKCPTYKVFASHVQVWVDPMPNVFETFEAAIALGRSWHNCEYTGYGIVEMTWYKLFAGVNMTTMKNDLKSYAPVLEGLNLSLMMDYIEPLKGVLGHLMKRKMTPVTEFLPSETQKMLTTAEAGIIKFTYWMARLVLHFLADDLTQARAACDELDVIYNAHIGTMFYSEYLMYKGLLAARMMMELEAKPADDSPLMKELHVVIDRYEYWATHCPSTFACRLHLLRGCSLWLRGETMAGVNDIDNAIDLAQQHNFPHVEAIANETAGRLWTMSKKRHLATVYMSAGHRAYRKWGAEWKANQMRHYEQVTNETSTQEGMQILDTQSAEQAALSGSMVDEVDVEMLCDWTIALASEKTQDALLEQFIRLAMLYTGSREGFMFWEKSDKVEAATVSDMSLYVHSTVDENAALHTTLHPTHVRPPLVPVANYVIRTKETISDSSPVLATFQKGGKIAPQAGSFLFHPVVHHGVCIGLLYLANDLSHKAFMSSKRMSLLKLLSSQLNISFENMRLLEELRSYNEALQEQTMSLEEMVAVRTNELELANQRLSSEVMERKKAEVVAVQAASANRSFLHNMSHELRTPLNCIIGMAELLSQTTLSQDQTEILEPIMLSAADLLQIINDILDLSKIESGKLTISKHPFSLREIVDNSLETIAALSLKKRITIAALYPADVPSALHSDSTRIGQVLRNLLSNAIKFTREGDITLHISAEPASASFLAQVVAASNTAASTQTAKRASSGSSSGYSSNGNSGNIQPTTENVYQFTVKCIDTGIGISEEQMARLFKAFSQGDHSTTRKFGGTGLGLNISKGFANLLQGDLTASSVVGQGSTFTFTFLSEVLEEDESISTRLPKNLTFVHCIPKPTIESMIRGYLDVNNSKFEAVESAANLKTYYESHLPCSNTVFIVDEQVIGSADFKPSTMQVPKIILTTADKPPNHSSDPLTTFIRHPVRSLRLVNAINAQFQGAVVKPAGKTPSKRAQYSMKVLLAEDNPVNRSVADRMLSKFGISAAMVEDGQQALDACGLERYDLVLMDVMMPVMDGHEATRQIRKNLPTDHQPLIIALTANAFVEDKIVCLNAGMDDVLTKPLTFASLDAMLLKHFKPSSR